MISCYRPTMSRFRLCLVLLVACGSSPETSPDPEPAPAPAENEEPAPEVEPEPEPIACTPGFETPFTPSAAHLRRNREALAMHRRGDYADAIAAFTELLNAAPGYGSAQFNLSCSQT